MESVEERNQCEGCKKPKSDVGIIRFRDEFNQYLCSKCCHRAMGEFDKICDKCDINNADGSFEMKQFQGKDMCADCIYKAQLKEEHRQAIKIKIKNFAKDHWKFWIGTAIGIIGLFAIF